MDSENNILFEQFLNGELSSGEHSKFIERLVCDTAFKEEYALFLLIVDGLKEKGKANIKADAKAASQDIKAKPYTPSSGGGGFSIAPVFGLLILAGMLTSLLIYSGTIKTKNKKVNQANEWLHEKVDYLETLMITDTIYRIDTVYYEIEVPAGEEY